MGNVCDISIRFVKLVTYGGKVRNDIIILQHLISDGFSHTVYLAATY